MLVRGWRTLHLYSAPTPAPRRDRVAVYKRHEPENTVLRRVVRAEFEPLLPRAREAGARAVRFVEREIRVYLGGGVMADGFLRVHCDDCGRDRFVNLI
jgi:hypothetical protein